MKISNKGLEIIKKSEGLRLKPYFCPAKVKTIGYGHVIRKNEGYLNSEITEEEAESLLRKDVVISERGVNSHVTVKLTQGQFDALVSFVFNLGSGSLAKSTLLKMLNAGEDSKDVAKQFGRWINAGGKKLSGLIKRREEEARLFLSE